MFPGGPNPSKLQTAPAGRAKRNPPLVLIHDGGGTTFGYFFLGSLFRDVWALHNPKYFDAEKWEGGMDEMAKHYLSLIRKAGIKGSIYLGGWSLGGLLSMAIARLLAEEESPDITVIGLAIIDSPRHHPMDQLPPNDDPDFGDLPDLVQKSFAHCDEMLEKWVIPSWDGPSCEGNDVQVRVAGKSFDLQPDQFLRRSLDAKWQVDSFGRHESSEKGAASGPAPPPGFIIRATKCTPRAHDEAHPCSVDAFRERPLLGWDKSYPDFLKATLDVDADHFSMFDKEDRAKIRQVTVLLNEGLQILDSLTAKGEKTC